MRRRIQCALTSASSTSFASSVASLRKTPSQPAARGVFVKHPPAEGRARGLAQTSSDSIVERTETSVRTRGSSRLLLASAPAFFT